MKPLDTDLLTYTAAKDAAKANLLKTLKEAIDDPAFDILSFAALLAQQEDAEDWTNPLHAIFDRALIRRATTYLAAANLLESAIDEAADNSDTDDTAELPADLEPEE